MDYKEHIEKAINYIEDNLRGEVNISDLAKVSGYSVYHFLRVFKEITGLTPADYIRKRRISEIASELIAGNEYVSEVAFQYGFNSKENFLRAFKNEHHILPTEYKYAENSLKLYEKFTFEKKEFTLTPKIITLEPFNVTAYKNDEPFAPYFWNKYNAKGWSEKLSGGEIVTDYGISLWNSDENRLDYWIGIKSEDAKGDISGTVQLDIKGGLYAVFSSPVTEQKNFVNNIHKSWTYINGTWLPESEYKHRDGYEFECYIERSRTFTEDIYIPIKRKDG